MLHVGCLDELFSFYSTQKTAHIWSIQTPDKVDPLAGNS